MLMPVIFPVKEVISLIIECACETVSVRKYYLEDEKNV